mmetsp:Transcript_118906/g.333000  ORF Transcript_118906/g.333000 Transcript_118906/m.333000 type:complete len:379 (+) Transcript_118906:51-1187(+)
MRPRAKQAGNSDTLVEVLARQALGVLVCPEDPVPIHEEVTVVEHEESVVHVVVGGRAEAQPAEQRVPRVGKLRVDQHEPIRIQGAEGDVRPDIRRHDARGEGERDDNHAGRVNDGPVEGVEEARVREAMVRLVGHPVEPHGDLVLTPMHEALDAILDQELCGHMHPIDATGEGVVRGRHPPEHPRADQVAADLHEALGLREVGLQPLHEVVGAIQRLNLARRAELRRPPQPVVHQHKGLADGHSEQPQCKAQRLDRARIRDAVCAQILLDRSLVVPRCGEHGLVAEPTPSKGECERQGADRRPHQKRRQHLHRGHLLELGIDKLLVLRSRRLRGLSRRLRRGLPRLVSPRLKLRDDRHCARPASSSATCAPQQVRPEL